MNENDSEVLSHILEQAGYQELRTSGYPDIKGPGIVLLNTCCVRENAEQKARGYLGALKNLKEKNPNVLIGLCGCIPQERGEEILKKYPYLDLLMGPAALFRFSEILKKLESGSRVVDLSEDYDIEHCVPERKNEKNKVLAYITIMRGCNNFCSYCIVPYVRGREQSRNVESILSEIKGLDPSIKEIMLLGQNVNSYKYGLAELLRKIDGLITEHGTRNTEHRIRFMTSHPRDMSDEIINAVKELPQFCEYFHLPLQHGDDEMLKAMNRGYDSGFYKRLVDKIRGNIPGAAVTSDIIVGFPGETDKQFQNSLKMIRECELDLVNTTAYSIRPKTKAALMKGHLPEEIKQERLQEVMRVVNDVALKQNRKLVGTTQEILVDQSASQPVGQSKIKDWKTGRPEDRRTFWGRTRTNKIVKFSGNYKIGDLAAVKITSAKAFILQGIPQD